MAFDFAAEEIGFKRNNAQDFLREEFQGHRSNSRGGGLTPGWPQPVLLQVSGGE
jgi:hypothetical protein